MAERFWKIRSARCSRVSQFFVCALALFLLCPLAEAQTEPPVSSAGDTDIANALVYLNRATAFFDAGNLEFARIAIGEGLSFSGNVADLFYLEAVLNEEEDYPAADVLASAYSAFGDSCRWYRFDAEAAALFTAELLVDTRRYQEALYLLDRNTTRASADADLLRCRIHYASGSTEAARALLSVAMRRWSNDIRFPLLFFQFEVPSAAVTGGAGSDTAAPGDGGAGNVAGSAAGADLMAAEIIAAWSVADNSEADTELSLAAFPFLAVSDSGASAMVIRRIWHMGGADALSSRLAPVAVTEAFRAGLLSGAEAAQAFFDKTAGEMRLRTLEAFCAVARNDAEACEKIAEILSSYEGVLSDDSNGDGIQDTFVSYRAGRPHSAVYDLNQDDCHDLLVECGFGEPVSVMIPGGDISVEYSAYPFPSSVKSGMTVFEMRRNAIRIAPVVVRPLDFGFLSPAFLFLETAEDFIFPSRSRLAAASVSSVETSYADDGGPGKNGGNELFVETVYDENGHPVSVRKTLGGVLVSDCVYRNGVPYEERRDEDGDGYFERRVFFDGDGQPVSISADIDRDTQPDYTEHFSGDGSVRICWYEKGKPFPAVQWTKLTDGRASAVWLHPETAIPVTVVFQGDVPAGNAGDNFTVTYRGGIRRIFYDEASGFWWFGNIPSASREIAASVNAEINQTDSPVVSLYVPADAGLVYVVKAGGKIFAEVVRANRAD